MCTNSLALDLVSESLRCKAPGPRGLHVLNLSKGTNENIGGLPFFYYNSAKSPNQEHNQCQETLPDPGVRTLPSNKPCIVFLQLP